MDIAARVVSRPGHHAVHVGTDGAERPLAIPPKASGAGSSANGGELLFLALATCCCNDVYREAAGRGIAVEEVEVEVTGAFGGVGEPARQIEYRARITAAAPEDAIRALAEHTDRVAEVQNTLRLGLPIRLTDVEAVSSGTEAR